MMDVDVINRRLMLKVTQQDYIEELQWRFGPDVTIALANYVVPDIVVKFRFVHFDPTKPDNRKIDVVKVVVKSSNEKPSDFCNFD